MDESVKGIATRSRRPILPPSEDTRRLGRRLAYAASAVVLSTLGFGVGLAQANQPNSSWSSNGVIGYCASTYGGYVLAAQNFLYGAEGYRPLDASFGANTTTATKAWQRQVGLSQDGCIGPNTWTSIRNQVYSLCSPGYWCPPPYWVSTANGGRVYYDRTNCDWGTATLNIPVGGSVKGYKYYSFSTLLTGEVSCA